MSDRVFYCPDCRRVYSDTRRPPHGQLFECAGCKLLFVPADKDFAGGVGPREYESAWAEAGEDVAPTAPYSAKSAVPKRHRRLAQKRDMLFIYLSALVMLAVGGVFLLIAKFAHLTPVDTPANTPVADAPGSKSETPVADAPGSKREAENEPLLGEWESTDRPLEGIGDREVTGLAFAARGGLTVTSRSGVEIETSTGRWRHSGAKLTLSFRDAAGMRDVELTVETLDGDRLRLAAGRGAAVEFRRKR